MVRNYRNAEFIEPMTLFILPAGGFFVLGAVIAVVNRLMKKKPREIGCHNCPNAEAAPVPATRQTVTEVSSNGNRKNLMIILLTGILTENFVLSKFLGICPS